MGISYSPKIATDGLVLCLDAANARSYPGTGTTWTDISAGFSDSMVSRSTADNGTLTNGPTFSSNNGGSIVFDGTNDVVDVASPPSITGDSATLALWCKSDDSANWRSPGGYVTSGFDDYRLTFRRLNTSNIRGYARYSTGGIQQTASYSISNSEFQSWNYYVVVASGGVVYLYLNGVIVSSGGSGSGDLDLGTTFTLGSQDSRSTGSWWNGDISNVQVYDRALSADEILQNYLATKGRYK